MACTCGGKGTCEECKKGMGSDLGVGEIGATNDKGGAEKGDSFDDVVSNVTDLAGKVQSGEMTRAEALMGLVTFIDSISSGGKGMGGTDNTGRMKPSDNTAVDEENM